MTFTRDDFILAFTISFSERTLQLQSLSCLVCGDQDLLETNEILCLWFFRIMLQGEMQSRVRRNEFQGDCTINDEEKCNLYSDSRV